MMSAGNGGNSSDDSNDSKSSDNMNSKDSSESETENKDTEDFTVSEFFPPPEDLLPKTIAPNEPLRTGSATPFLKLKPLKCSYKD